MNSFMKFMWLISFVLRYAFPIAAVTVREGGLFYVMFLAWLETVIAGIVMIVLAMAAGNDEEDSDLMSGLFVYCLLMAFLCMLILYSFSGVDVRQLLFQARIGDLVLATVSFAIGYVLYFRSQQYFVKESTFVIAEGVAGLLMMRIVTLLVIFACAAFVGHYFGNYQMWWTGALFIKVFAERAIAKVENA